MTTETIPTKPELEKAIAEAQSAYDEARANAKTAMAEENAKDDPDYNRLAASSGAVKTAEGALNRAKAALVEFEKGERFATLRQTNRPILTLLSNAQKDAPTVAVSALSGDITIDAEGNVTVSARPVITKPDMTAFEARIAEIVKANLAAYKDVGVSEMSFTVPDIGKTEGAEAVKIGPKGSSAPKAPKAKGESNGSGGKKIGWTLNGQTMTSSELLDWTLANRDDVVTQHAKSFQNYRDNGSKMNGLSNLAKLVAPKVGAAEA